MEASNPRRMEVMAAPRKYPDELRERAVRLAVDARRDPATRTGALRRIGEQLGINPETLRNWVTQAEIDQGPCPLILDTQRVSKIRGQGPIVEFIDDHRAEFAEPVNFSETRSCWVY